VVEIGVHAASWDDAVTEFFAAPVDPVETGWELQVAQEQASGEVAVLARMHHALGDGLAVTDALLRLLADDPPAVPRADPARRGRRPALVEAALLLRGVVGLARAGTAGASALTGPVTGPRHARVAACLDGAGVRAAARRHGVGTTALLLAVLAEALHGLPGGRATVRAMVPVTVRTRAGVPSRGPGNRTAGVPVELPVGRMPPDERVAAVARALRDGTGGGRPEAAAAVLAVLGLLPARAQPPLVRLVYGRRFFHLLASVMPGVRRPVRLRGGRVRAAFPVLPLAEGVGLAVGAAHCGAVTCVGITADPGLVPGYAALSGRMQSALECLGGAPCRRA
jgi:hypothetical protein